MADTQAKIILTGVDNTRMAFEQVKANLSGIGAAASALPAKFGTIGTAIAAAFSVASMKGAIDMLDQMDDMAEKTGISVSRLSELRYASEAAGTSQEQLATGLRKLAKEMAEAAGGNAQSAAMFQTLGIQVTDATGKLRDTDKVLEDIAQRFSGWGDGPAKAAWSMQLFGKSGEDLIPVLNLGREGLRALSDEARAMGAVLDGDLAKSAAQFNDNLTKLSLAASAAKASLFSDLIIGLSETAKAFVRARTEGEGFFTAMAKGWQTLATGSDEYKANKRLVELTDELLTAERNLADAEARGAGRVTNGKKLWQAEVDRLRSEIATTQAMRADMDGARASAVAASTGSGPVPRLPGAAAGSAAREAQRAYDEARKRDLARGEQRNKLAEQSAKERAQAEKERAQVEKEALRAGEQLYELNERRFQQAEQADDQATRLIEDIRFETSLLRLNNEQRAEAIELRRLESIGIARDSERYGELAGGVAAAARERAREQQRLADEEASRYRTQSIAQSIEDGILNGTRAGKSIMDTFRQELVAQWSRTLLRPLITPIAEAGNGLFGDVLDRIKNLPGLGSLASEFGTGSAFGNMDLGGFFAEGGRPPMGIASVVGERGPELFVPDQPGTIVPNHRLGGTTIVSSPVINIDARADAATVEANVRRAINASNRELLDMLERQGRL